MQRQPKVAYYVLVASILFSLSVAPVQGQGRMYVLIDPASEEVYQTLMQFLQYDRYYPLNPQVVEKRDMTLCTREKIVFNGLHDRRVPGYLAIPKTDSPPYPCVLLPHYQEGSKSSGWEEDSQFAYHKLRQELLSAGFAVCALDALYHGERTASNDYVSTGTMVEKQYWRKIVDQHLQSVVEYRLALDYLSTRTEIDTTRIGVLGCSMGGMVAFVLTAADPRIKVTVAASVPTSGPWIADTYSVAALHNYTRGIGDRPLLMLMGRNEERFFPEEAEHLHKLINSRSSELIFYDSGHFLSEEYVDDAMQWLKEHL